MSLPPPYHTPLPPPGWCFYLFPFTHPLGVEVLFDLEAVDHAGGRQAAFHAGQEEQQQGQLGVFHSARGQTVALASPPLIPPPAGNAIKDIKDRWLKVLPAVRRSECGLGSGSWGCVYPPERVFPSPPGLYIRTGQTSLRLIFIAWN